MPSAYPNYPILLHSPPLPTYWNLLASGLVHMDVHKREKWLGWWNHEILSCDWESYMKSSVSASRPEGHHVWLLYNTILYMYLYCTTALSSQVSAHCEVLLRLLTTCERPNTSSSVVKLHWPPPQCARLQLLCVLAASVCHSMCLSCCMIC